MSLEHDPREEKLSRWAQTALRKARHEKALAEDRLSEFTKTVKESRAWHFRNYENPVYFPETDQVSWRFGNSDTFDTISVKPNLESGILQIRGGQALRIYPSASNVFEIELRN